MRKKILLVDDTATVITLEKVILGAGYDYVEAHNGEEAFSRALADRPDLILMDLNMPLKDGVDGLRSLKAEQRTAAIPVVMVSTQNEPPIVELCRSLGCADFIGKPIDREHLKTTVRRHLGEAV